MNFEQHFLTCSGPSWSGLIHGSMCEWCRKEERRQKRGRKSYQTVVHCLSQKCNIIYSGICKSNNHSALFTKGTCWFRVWKRERARERERNNPSHRCQHTVYAQRQPLATKSVVFLRIRKWRVSGNFLVVSQLQKPLNLFWWGWIVYIKSHWLCALYAIYILAVQSYKALNWVWWWITYCCTTTTRTVGTEKPKCVCGTDYWNIS